MGKLHAFHADKWAFDKCRSVFWSGQRAGLRWVITSSQRGVRGRKRSLAERGLRGAVEELRTRTTCWGAQAWYAPNVSDQLCHCLCSPLSFLLSQERIGLPPCFPEPRLAFFCCCHLLSTIFYLSFGICSSLVLLFRCDMMEMCKRNSSPAISVIVFSPACYKTVQLKTRILSIYLFLEEYLDDSLEEWCAKLHKSTIKVVHMH